MTELQELWLNNNQIGDDGAAALAPVRRAIQGRGGDCFIG